VALVLGCIYSSVHNNTKLAPMDEFNCNRTSRKQPPKISSLGGRIREVVAYESLDHIGWNFSPISIWQLWRTMFEMFYSCEKSISSCTTQECNNVTTPYYPICAILSVKWSLTEVKKKWTFQTFSSRSGCGRLREVVAYKRLGFDHSYCSFRVNPVSTM